MIFSDLKKKKTSTVKVAMIKATKTMGVSVVDSSHSCERAFTLRTKICATTSCLNF